MPDYESQVERVGVSKAARFLREVIRRGGRASWDLECTTLKPESGEAEIVCCAVCWEGKKTFAFPWHGEVIEAMRDFLLSPVKKIAANMKYEDRFVSRKLGVEVKNWHFDTMQAAHIEDNREGVTSLKFQAFVRLGQGGYDEHIESYLKSKNSNKANQIKRLSMRELLLYCGMDALLEFKLAEIQMREMGYEVSGT